MSDVGVGRGNARDAQSAQGDGDAHAEADSRSPAGEDAGRRRHYGAFYGLEPLPEGPSLAIIHGNCQAESLRLAVDGPDLPTIRIPPVHELTAEDLPHLTRTLARVTVLISQPVRDGYRDLPLGSRELTAVAAPAAVVVLVPVIRFAGLYPAQAIIRPPSDRSAVPPLLPYHDLRTLAEAAGGNVTSALSPAGVRAVAALSREELCRREAAHGTLPVADLFHRPCFEQMRTINHPGNLIWEVVARRLRARLELDDIVPLGRSLLDGIHAPREPDVIDALGLETPPRPNWRVDGEPVDPAEVRHAHLAWYRRHPDAVREGLRRHATVLATLFGR